MKEENRSVSHRFFTGCYEGAQPFTFVFDKELRAKPSPSVVEEYRKNREIVEAHGGRMRQCEHELGGRTEPFSRADQAEMKFVVINQYADLEFMEDWNGAGCHTYSVGMRLLFNRGVKMTAQTRLDKKYAETVARHDADMAAEHAESVDDHLLPDKDSPGVAYAKAGIAYYEAALKAQCAIARANQMAAYAQLSMARSSPTTFYRNPACIDAMMIELEHAVLGDDAANTAREDIDVG